MGTLTRELTRQPGADAGGRARDEDDGVGEADD
jgi:hypothetical protein